ncbi:ABC transporter permease [Luteolibacter ambystomatis]|uniref:ABC transporter permease n=1 Tax=Luteolibacter ambystomatis TaxID=2824561 RepID=A0A975J244_9BACT|nr:ABC transporter permease [Luteolibacter ambystomatis]QUE52604.1 ABC transporter permease [Luteolibacter ambystomatis]
MFRGVTLFRLIGRLILDLIEYLGEIAMLVAETFVSLTRGKIRPRLVLHQIVETGYRSQPVVIVTGAFTGAVLAAQAMFQFKPLGMETGGGALVSVAMLRELGPSVTALMLAGRVGAAMAAEIGTMKVTEQVDALRSMDVHPIDYLVTPRLLAMVMAMPLLIAESAGFGIIASVIVGVGPFGVNPAYWLHQMGRYTDITDILIALTKGSVFGLLIVIISCHQGLKANQGAVGVGRGTTRAMVYSALAILIVNFFLTLFLNIIFPAGAAMK